MVAGAVRAGLAAVRFQRQGAIKTLSTNRSVDFMKKPEA
jgi:hypothetical protein